MTLAEIMRLALRQLDEDPADVAEYDDLFRMWANQGYQIIHQNYYKPRETLTFSTDDKGAAGIEGLNILNIVTLRDENGLDVTYTISADGTRIDTSRRDAILTAVCEVLAAPMQLDTDEPRIPEHAHSMLVDYICYKHLMRGNLAKQNRAQAFQTEFYRQAQQLKPQGSGSVKSFKNLYSATDIRRARW